MAAATGLPTVANAATPAPGEVAALAGEVLTGIEVRRPTWTRANLLAEAARATRHLRAPDTAARIALLDEVVEAALAGCIALDPPEVFHTPARFRRLDGTSMFDRPSEASFTTTAVLDAEAGLLAALGDVTAPAVPAAVLQGLGRPVPGQQLSPDQQAAITGIATSARRLDVLIGPAGTGKTRTLAILTRAWAHTHGPGSVLGLAPSAAAAAELAAALRIPCENTAKWLHDHDTHDERQGRAATHDAGDNRTRALSKGRGGPAAASAGSPPINGMRAGMLVIVDEASLASTAHLDRLLQHASAAGAKLLLVGDDQQLGAVDAGGAFSLLVDAATAAATAHTLDTLWRFTNRWEARATRALRVGDPAALAAYAEHGRLHDGDTDTMTEAAYQAWQADLAAGKASLLLAHDRDTVTALNMRGRTDRHDAGHLYGPETALHDSTACAAGDWIITRQNDRRLPTPGGGHVRNGAAWTVGAVHPDGSLDVFPRGRDLAAAPSQSAGPPGVVRLPARYVAEHVELGYASTIHRAQGSTVDTAHVIARSGVSRQALYVAMTRGRTANHVYVTIDGRAEAHQGSDLTGRQILEHIVATDGREHSATATLRTRQNAATSLGRLTAARDAMAAALVDSHFDGDLERAVVEVNDLIRRRLESQGANGPVRRQRAPATLDSEIHRPSIGGS